MTTCQETSTAIEKEDETLAPSSTAAADIIRPSFPQSTLYLPGRSVDLLSTTTPSRRGVVVDVMVNADPTQYVLRYNADGRSGTATGDMLRPVHPDRPTLAHDDLYAETLGRLLAERAGPDVLARFEDGHNNGRTAYRESARGMLRRLDQRAFEVKHSGCQYTYVVDPDGQRRPGRSDYVDGDVLVVCPWYGDGPRRIFCAVHSDAEARGDRSSIFYPSDDGPWRFQAPVAQADGYADTSEAVAA